MQRFSKETTGFSRVESQFLPIVEEPSVQVHGKSARWKLRLHAAEADGLSQNCVNTLG